MSVNSVNTRLWKETKEGAVLMPDWLKLDGITRGSVTFITPLERPIALVEKGERYYWLWHGDITGREPLIFCTDRVISAFRVIDFAMYSVISHETMMPGHRVYYSSLVCEAELLQFAPDKELFNRMCNCKGGQT